MEIMTVGFKSMVIKKQRQATYFVNKKNCILIFYCYFAKACNIQVIGTSKLIDRINIYYNVDKRYYIEEVFID